MDIVIIKANESIGKIKLGMEREEVCVYTKDYYMK